MEHRLIEEEKKGGKGGCDEGVNKGEDWIWEGWGEDKGNEMMVKVGG